MEELSNLKCSVCGSGDKALTLHDIERYDMDVPEWDVVDSDDVMKLMREFHVKNFKEALSLTSQIGELAEEHGHHPVIVTEWAKVTVYWWTHKVNGLHLNDFIMAAKVDELI